LVSSVTREDPKKNLRKKPEWSQADGGGKRRNVRRFVGRPAASKVPKKAFKEKKGARGGKKN